MLLNRWRLIRSNSNSSFWDETEFCGPLILWLQPFFLFWHFNFLDRPVGLSSLGEKQMGKNYIELAVLLIPSAVVLLPELVVICVRFIETFLSYVDNGFWNMLRGCYSTPWHSLYPSYLTPTCNCWVGLSRSWVQCHQYWAANAALLLFFISLSQATKVHKWYLAMD